MRNHQPVVINKFNGVWDRTIPDDVPIGKLRDGLNLDFNGGCGTRKGFSNLPAFGGLTVPFAIRRIETFKRIGEADRLLILDTSGNIYDSTNLSSPILTIAAMTDFAVLCLYNRAYISPHNGEKGLAGESVYVYQGSGVARSAAGLKPSGTALTITDSASSGYVEQGEHLFAVGYLTDTGFPTRPNLYTLYTAPGLKKATISSIPIGPSGTVSRIIYATRVLTDAYNFNPESYEYFEVYELTDNTSTSVDVDFFDSDLQSSVDYILDFMETIPAGVHLTEYRGGMILGGTDANPSTEFISRANAVESFSISANYLNVNPGDACDVVKNAVSYRDQLYLLKDQRWYVTSDNGGDPYTWNVIPVDSAMGTSCHGVVRILDAKGISTEKFIFADRSGLVLFDGSSAGARLTIDIDKIWARINANYFNRIEVVLDPVNFFIYVAAPLDTATENSHILFGDYSDKQNFSDIKWCPWKLLSIRPTSLVVDVDYTTKKSILKIGSLDEDIHALTPTLLNDTTGAIESYMHLPYTPQAGDGKLFHFGSARMRVRGAGALSINIYGMDDAESETLASLTMSSAPGQMPSFLMNYVGEVMSMKFGTNNASSWFHVNNLTLFMKVYGQSRAL